MRAFVNINGIDLFYSDIVIENNVETLEVKASFVNPSTKSIKSASFKLPGSIVTENNGFDEKTIKYLIDIIKHSEGAIFEDSKTLRGRSVSEKSYAKVGDKVIPIRKDEIEDE